MVENRVKNLLKRSSEIIFYYLKAHKYLLYFASFEIYIGFFWGGNDANYWLTSLTHILFHYKHFVGEVLRLKCEKKKKLERCLNPNNDYELFICIIKQALYHYAKSYKFKFLEKLFFYHTKVFSFFLLTFYFEKAR